MQINEAWLQKNTLPAVRERGAHLYRTGTVRPGRTATGYGALVRGTGDYDVQIFEKAGNLRADCTCPYEESGLCKHIVAVILAIQNGDIDENPSATKIGLFDLERSNDPDFFEKYYTPAAAEAKAKFPRAELEENQAQRMLFLQELRG